jgi:hypothetical protein
MTDPNTQIIRWIDADGKEVMTGKLSKLAEHLPDTPARDAALSSMLKTAAEAVEAEQRRDQALASTAQMISDAVERLMARVDREEQCRAEQERIKAEQAEQEEQQRIQDELAALPDPDNPDPFGAAGDDDQLSVHPAVDPERYGPTEDDAEAPVKPVLSYGRVPTSYIRKKDATADLPEGVESRAPAPLGTDPIYDPKDLAYPPPRSAKQTPQPIDVSLHEE